MRIPPRDTILRAAARVPATTSNLGPGFDALGMALTLYNEVEVELRYGSGPGAVAVEVKGEGAGTLPTDETNEIARVLIDQLGRIKAKIAALMGIADVTLQKHYRYELDHGEEIANANVAANLYRIACSNAPSAAGAAQYWLNKRSEKFKETPRRLELTGKNGAPVAVASAQLTLDPRKLTADQRDALRDILMAATEDGGDDREDSEGFDTAVDPELDAAEAKTYVIAADAPGEIGEPDAELDADDPASGFA